MQPPPADPIIGIDLGTTNSLAAFCDSRGPRVLPDSQGRDLLPSVVRFSEQPASSTDRPLIGHAAVAQAADHPRSTIFSVKRLMGRSLADAAPDLPFLTYEVVAGDHDTARVRVPLSDGSSRIISPQEVSAHILRELKEQASRALGTQVTRAVVTVPAYFDDTQRQATRDAGRLAGLDVLRIINEPTAAALAYGLGTTPAGASPQLIAVYDLGGGTFDISILRLTPSASPDEPAFFEVLSTAGDTHLGGDDADHALVNLFASHLLAKGLSSPSQSFKRTLIHHAQRVKHTLSEADQATATIELPQLNESLAITVTRAHFESLITPLIDRTIESCQRALTDAMNRLAQESPAPPTLSAVIMVGGSTRIPLVRRRVGEFFGLEPYTALNPDQVVALGAAVQADILSGSRKGSLLLDVIPLSLGLETMGGAVAKLIIRNSTVPARAKEMFSTSVDGQTSIKLAVYQGEREMAENCRKLAEFHLRGLPPMPAGIPQLEVDFLVDANGVLIVSAHERRSGKRASLQIIPNHGLTRDEVDQIERDSFTHARDDMTRHRIADLITNSTLDLKWIGQRLAIHRDRLDPDYRSALDTKIAALQSLITKAKADWKSVNPDEFYTAKNDLDQTSIRLQEISIAASLNES